MILFFLLAVYVRNDENIFLTNKTLRLICRTQHFVGIFLKITLLNNCEAM
jgi:hypothetical protein